MSKKKKVIKKTVTTTVEEVEINELTEVVAILDRSGSMYSIIDDAIGGFNSYIKKQKESDIPTNVTVALFDDRYELIYNSVDLKEVEDMTRKTWSPRGSTALFDAIGRTISSVENRIEKTKKADRPSKVLVAIVTDGHENSSREYNRDSINKLIEKKKEDDWQFIFLAADQDAFAAGTAFGIAGGNTFNYTNTSFGNKVMFDTLSDATLNYRGMSSKSPTFATASATLMTDAEAGTTGKVDVTVSDSLTLIDDQEDTEE